MSKIRIDPSADLEKIIMAKVKSNKIVMKPKWYFVVGSLLTVAGLVGSSIGAVFLTNITLFLLKRHGPMGQWKLQQLLTSFPLWIPVLAIIGIALGLGMLRKYDFSYKKNFAVIILGFIFSIVLAAYMIDRLGLNDVWSRQGPMKRLYQGIESQNSTAPKETGRGRFYRQSQ